MNRATYESVDHEHYIVVENTIISLELLEDVSAHEWLADWVGMTPDRFAEAVREAKAVRLAALKLQGRS